MIEVDFADLVLVLMRADMFTEWDQISWKARASLIKAAGLGEVIEDEPTGLPGN